MEQNLIYDHWMTDDDGTEDDMEKGHQKFWERIIHYYKEKDLSDKEILDFGCNQGAFAVFICTKAF